MIALCDCESPDGGELFALPYYCALVKANPTAWEPCAGCNKVHVPKGGGPWFAPAPPLWQKPSKPARRGWPKLRLDRRPRRRSNTTRQTKRHHL